MENSSNVLGTGACSGHREHITISYQLPSIWCRSHKDVSGNLLFDEKKLANL